MRNDNHADMDGADAIAGAPEHFSKSELFHRTFQDGMNLVEETAAYLDGPGREESKSLSRGAALAYAGESMRLTTRLMQVASWLLVQRAVREGEIAVEEAAERKYRLGGKQDETVVAAAHAAELPAALLALIERCGKLYDRVRRIDADLYRAEPAAPRMDVARQLMAVRDAFPTRL
ncbi:MAG: DUF1465 family protein [Pseudomonadota bacterium]